MANDDAKRLAAETALKLLPERGVIGLGSGSTARLFIDAVGRLVKEGRELVGVPTSNQSRKQAEALGIPLLPDTGPWSIDVCVDGADEVSAALDLIKGGGRAHTREKVVNHASRMNVIIVDESKLSTHLGEKWAVPVEVLRFGALATAEHLMAVGEARFRPDDDGQPVLTDADNFIVDVRVGAIQDPRALDARLRSIPGVVETGLFIARADRVIVAGSSGVRVLTRGS
jgi:ribose 5-phosphate isomerase A